MKKISIIARRFIIWCRVDDGTAGQVSGESCEAG